MTWLKKYKDPISIAVAISGVVVAIAIFLFSIIPTWYADQDGDGFGDPNVSKLWVWQPSGFVKNSNDCYDKNKEARPGVESYFKIDRGDGSFDYNCDGTSTKEQTKGGSCSGGTANKGWDGDVPACGKKGEWLVDCDRMFIFIKIKIIREKELRIQGCR